MLQQVLRVYGMNLKMAELHVRDLTDAQMVEQPAGVINHPAWTLAHLAMVADNLAKMLGLESTFPEAWRAASMPGGTPTGNAADYPTKQQLLDELTVQHERVAAEMAKADAGRLAQPHPNERARERFPTVGDYAAALMTTHEAGHLGQLAAWRRAMGLTSATGR